MRLTTLVLFVAACTSSPSNNMSGDGGGGGGTQDLSLLAMNDLAGMTPHDLASSAYPAGPYGHTVGATFPPLVWEGYVATTGDVVVNTLPFGPYSADAVRTSGKRYAMIHISEFF